MNQSEVYCCAMCRKLYWTRDRAAICCGKPPMYLRVAVTRVIPGDVQVRYPGAPVEPECYADDMAWQEKNGYCPI